MEKRIRNFLILFLVFSSLSVASADTLDWYKEYGATDEVNFLNLNGNYRNIINWANGGIANDNIKTGYKLFEILGSLPLAGDEGRVVYRTTTNTMHFDDGSAWVEVPTSTGSAVQGDILYFNGTIWSRLAAGTAGNTLKTGGSGANPSWASLNLAGGSNYVTGVLPLANFATSTLVIDGDTAGGVLGGTYPNPTFSQHDASSSTTNFFGISDEITTNPESYVKAVSFRILRGGTITVKFDLKVSNASYTAYGKIYKNGVAHGIEQTNGTTDYLTKSQDLAFSDGDTVELWIRVNDVAAEVYVKNFKLCSDLTYSNITGVDLIETHYDVTDPTFIAPVATRHKEGILHVDYTGDPNALNMYFDSAWQQLASWAD